MFGAFCPCLFLSSMWRKGEIQKARQLTPQSAEFILVLKGGMPGADPGQFVVIETQIQGASVRASFSLLSIAQDEWRLAVKQARVGGVSEWLCALQEPVDVRVAGPFGDFALLPGFEHHAFIAGGSGITPIYCMVNALIQAGEIPTLYFCNSAPEEAMYLSEVQDWALHGRIKLVEVFGQGLVSRMEWDDFRNAAVYVCGPQAMTAAALAQLEQWGISEGAIATETYKRDISNGEASNVRWKGRFRSEKEVAVAADESLLQALRRSGTTIDAACLVGACRTCEVVVASGRVVCNGRVFEAGELVPACAARPLPDNPVVLRPSKGLSRAQWFIAAVLIGLVFMGMWNVPPGLGFSSMGSMNTGHSSLSCESCHRPAEGTLRQQLGHNAKTALGVHDHDWAAVGYAEVDNQACQSCHERPNDRHPVSRFKELRFAAQREVLGVHQCVNCHGEHAGKRVAKVEMDFCQHCHASMEVKDDPLDVPHSDLVSNENWASCLTCHDFHGNHMHSVPTRMADRLRESEILDYFDGEIDPYGQEKRYRATNEKP